MKCNITLSFFLSVLYLNLHAQQTYSLKELHYRIDNIATINGRPRIGPVPQSLITLSNAYTNQVPQNGVFGLEGVGSLSTEELTKANGSGKISFLVNPYPILFANGRSLQNITHISLNKNATNNADSLLTSTILFPELGNVSFNGTTELMLKVNKRCEETQYYISAFFDFALKDVRSDVLSNAGDSALTTLYFNTLSYSAGLRFLIQHYYVANNEIKCANFSATLYGNTTNIPDEDYYDYKTLVGDSTTKEPLGGMGVKLTAQLNNFAIFADLRHTFYDHKIEGSHRDLKGFSSNIGIAVMADIFRF